MLRLTDEFKDAGESSMAKGAESWTDAPDLVRTRDPKKCTSLVTLILPAAPELTLSGTPRHCRRRRRRLLARSAQIRPPPAWLQRGVWEWRFRQHQAELCGFGLQVSY